MLPSTSSNGPATSTAPRIPKRPPSPLLNSPPKRVKTAGGTTQTLSIVSWNVDDPVKAKVIDLQPNKLSFAGLNKRPSASLRPFLRRHNFPDFLCLNEVRAKPTDKDWIAALKASPNLDAASDEPLYDAHFSLCRAVKGPRRFGVAVYSKRELASSISNVREVGWDHEGRCVVVDMPSLNISLFAVYALNSSEYAWTDPLYPEKPTGMTRSQRKCKFNELLMGEVTKVHALGRHAVLIGDFNVTLTKADCFPRLRTEEPHATNRRVWIEQYSKAGLVDIFRHLHPSERQYSWFAKGKPHGSDAARVDYALVSRHLIDRCIRSEYWQDPKERGYSDHAPFILQIEVDLEKTGKGTT